MEYESKIKKLFEDRLLDEARVMPSVCNFIFTTREVEEPFRAPLMLSIYSKILALGGEKFEVVENLGLDSRIIDRGLSIALAGLVVGASLKQVKLMEDGGLVLDFDNGISLQILGISADLENSWILHEADDSTISPQTEIHCSNTGFVDEYTIG